MVLLICKN